MVTITWRPGYIDSIVQALRAQTMPPNDWEWVLVDDLFELRKGLVREHIGGAFSYQHLPPREITEYSGTAIAFNTGLAAARGDLLYLMSDYLYPAPCCLERHWYVYQKYGPKVIISGPLLDGITSQGMSVWRGAPPVRHATRIKDTVKVIFEHSPPIFWPLKQDIERPTKDNLLSIFRTPFVPKWPAVLLPDWRTGAVANVKLEPEVYECTSGSQWWWAGKNDSAPTALVREAGGLDESKRGQHGGLDTILAAKLTEMGCRFLVDISAVCVQLPHPFRKPEVDPL